jgi:hypothetical protein
MNGDRGFVARVLAQIPDRRRHLVRDYGAGSNATRAARKRRRGACA